MTQKQYNKYLKYAAKCGGSYELNPDYVHDAWVNARKQGQENNANYIATSIANNIKKYKYRYGVRIREDKLRAVNELFYNKPFETLDKVDEILDIEGKVKKLNPNQLRAVRSMIDVYNTSQAARNVGCERKTLEYHLREARKVLYGTK